MPPPPVFFKVLCKKKLWKRQLQRLAVYATECGFSQVVTWLCKTQKYALVVRIYRRRRILVVGLIISVQQKLSVSWCSLSAYFPALMWADSINPAAQGKGAGRLPLARILENFQDLRPCLFTGRVGYERPSFLLSTDRAKTAPMPSAGFS